MYDLEGKLRQGSKAMGGLPYEFRALEAILISVITGLDAEIGVLQSLVNELLKQLEEDVDRDRLRNLLVYSKKLSGFQKKATLIRNTFEELLDADEDLAGMYLSEKTQGKFRENENHDEIELLLESYLKQTDEIVQTADTLASNMRNTEEIVNIILDANRNTIMLLDLKVSIVTLGVGGGAMMAGLFGMNLQNYMEGSPYAFPIMAAAAFALSAFICTTGLRRIKRVQKLTLYGQYGKRF